MNRLDFFHDYWNPINLLSIEQRKSLMDFGMGMPSPKVFPTPRILIEKLHESIEQGDYCKYMPTEGGHELLHDICTLENQRLTREQKDYKPQNVMLVPGGIQAFSLIVDNLISKTQKILVPNPSYFSLGALSEEHKLFKVIEGKDLNFTFMDYVEMFKEDVGLAWFCQPNNPTGLYIKDSELTGIINLANDNSCFVVLDESCDNYRYIEDPGLPVNIRYENVIRIRTFSKDPNLAGLRLAYILASENVISRLKRISPILYGNPNVIGIRAIHAYIRLRSGAVSDENYSDLENKNFELMKRSRDFIYNKFNQCLQVENVILPEACYYMFVMLRFSGGSRMFQKLLLEHELLDVVPGTIFGVSDNENWIRVCFARDEEFLSSSFKKIQRVLNEY